MPLAGAGVVLERLLLPVAGAVAAGLAGAGGVVRTGVLLESSADFGKSVDSKLRGGCAAGGS